MSARRPSQEEQQRLLEAERVRLRRIGITTVVVTAAVVIVAFVALASSGGDSRDAVLVIGASTDQLEDLEKDQLVRVRGTVRNALNEDRFDDLDRTNAIDAETVTVVRSDAGIGLTDLDQITDDSDLRGRTVTVIGQVVDEPVGRILSIAKDE